LVIMQQIAGCYARVKFIVPYAALCRASTGIAGLKVQYSSSKGFYLVVPEQQGRQQAAATSMHGRGLAGSGAAGAAAAGAATQLPK
jgi:hypothetical protein